METTQKADITEEQLLADGWVKSTEKNPVFLFTKDIENRNPINSTPEDSDIKLVIHCMYNEWTFAILFPDGGMINFIANSMKELQNFESRINFYDPPF